MKVTFKLTDRLLANSLLPEMGDLITQSLVRSILEKVSITPQEIQDWEIKATVGPDGKGSNITWNVEKEVPKEVELFDPEIGLLKEGVRKLIEEKRVSQQNYNLCAMINSL